MQCSNKKILRFSFLLFLFLILSISVSFAATAKWIKSTSQTYANPVIDSDAIYIATASGTVYKFEKSNGSEVWRSAVNGAIFVSPLVYGDYIYVASTEGIFSLSNSNGDVIGQYSTSPQKVLTTPLINENKLFVVAENHVLIFDLSSKEKLTQPISVNLNGNTEESAFVNGEGISLFLTDGRLVYISSTGRSETIFNLGRTVWKANPILSGDIIYFGSERRLYVISTTGAEHWHQEFNGWISAPIIHENKIYVGCNDGYLYVLNQTGKIIDKFETGDAVLTPSISKNTIYLPSKDNNIYAVDIKTLTQKWNMTLDDWPSTPIISDSVIYDVSFNGTLYVASTLGCEITEPAENASVASNAFLSGIAYSDTGLKSVEIQIENGPWALAKLMKEKWEINYPIPGVGNGSNVTARCRASDNTSTEIAPYNSRTLIYVSSEDKLPRVIVSYPEKVTSGRDFIIEFKDEAGNSLKNVRLRYVNKEYEANGSIAITAVEGETAIYVLKPNYKTEVITIQVERPSLTVYIVPAAIIIAAIAIIAFLFRSKVWR